MLVGRVTKDNADRRRIIVDFAELDWLDNGEVVASFTPPTVKIEPAQIGTMPPATFPPPPVPDSTPLVITSSALSSDQTQVILFAEHGTVSLTYRVIFVATGSTSTRKKQVDVLVYIRE